MPKMYTQSSAARKLGFDPSYLRKIIAKMGLKVGRLEGSDITFITEKQLEKIKVFLKQRPGRGKRSV